MFHKGGVSGLYFSPTPRRGADNWGKEGLTSRFAKWGQGVAPRLRRPRNKKKGERLTISGEVSHWGV